MKVRYRLKNVVFLALVLIMLAGCGKQKVVELPTAEATTEAATEVQSESTIELPTAEVTVNDPTPVPESGIDTSKEDASADTVAEGGTDTSADETSTDTIAEDGVYTSKDDVAAYIHEYGKLPQNFITKKEAKALGWPGGSLEEYAPGKCIGGDRFGNYEGLLPEEKGRKYYECDIGTLGKSSRGAKRIIYSNDGLIFYTSDHYESFTQLY